MTISLRAAAEIVAAIGLAVFFCGAVYVNVVAPHPTAFGGAVEIIVPDGHGSGFFIDQTHVVTAAHVVANVPDGSATAEAIVNGKKVDVVLTLVKLDTKQDIAILQVTKPWIGSFTTLLCRDPSVGEDVTIVGYPLSLGRVQTRGYVAEDHADHIGETAQNGFTPEWPKAFVIDANIAPGNSGGPVYDGQGNVLGLVSAVPFSVAASPFTGMPETQTDFDLGIIIPASEVCADLKPWGVDTASVR